MEITGKRTFWLAIVAMGGLTAVSVGGMGFKVLDGEQIKSLWEWGLPWTLGIFGVRTGVEYFAPNKKGNNGTTG